MNTKNKKASAPLTWSGLAVALGTTRASLGAWRKLPGAPTTTDAAAWARFVEITDLGGGGGRDLQELRAELLREQIARARRANEREARELIPLKDAVEAATNATAQWGQVLRRLLEDEAPKRCEGKTVSELRVEFRAIHDELIAAYRAQMGKYVARIADDSAPVAPNEL